MRRRGGVEDSTNSGFLDALSTALGLQGSAPLGPLAFPQKIGMGAPLTVFTPSERTKNQEQAMMLKQGI